MRLIMLSLLIVAAAAGCIGQAPAGPSSLAVSITADPPAIRTDEVTTLFVDVQNIDETPLVKVFLEVFQTGPLAIAIPPREHETGKVQLKAGEFQEQRQVFNPATGRVETLPVRIAIGKSCTSSADCFDEEFGGCGVCVKEDAEGPGKCAAASGSAGLGVACEKTCECGIGALCLLDRGLGARLCRSSVEAGVRCVDGTPANSPSLSSFGMWCAAGGELIPACGGPDGIPSTAWAGLPGATLATYGYEPGCPSGEVCRGDGTCAPPGGCFLTAYGIEPRGITGLECGLALPEGVQLVQPATPVPIEIRAILRKRLTGTAVFDVIQLEELRRRERTGQAASQPATYEFGDRNVRLSLAFSKSPPFVQGERVLATLQARSVGEGNVFRLLPTDFSISQPGRILDCALDTLLRSEKGVFPPVTCEVNVPQQIAVAESYPISVTLYYDYEIRKSSSVTVTKV